MAFFFSFSITFFCCSALNLAIRSSSAFFFAARLLSSAWKRFVSISSIHKAEGNAPLELSQPLHLSRALYRGPLLPLSAS